MSSAETPWPRLIVVTSDDVIARPGFMEHAASIMDACGARVALQLRARAMKAADLYDTGRALKLRADGTMLFVNERLDVALALAADGVQLGANAVPVAAARAAAQRGGRDLLIGASVHSAADAATAAADGADLVILGTIWASASHPGREGSGVALVEAAAAACAVPVYAIGGVTPERARAALDSGAYGAAVITGVWDAPDPAEAAVSFLEAMQVMS